MGQRTHCLPFAFPHLSAAAQAHHAGTHDCQRAEQLWQEAKRAGELYAGLRGGLISEVDCSWVHCKALQSGTSGGQHAVAGAVQRFCRPPPPCPPPGALASEHRRAGGCSGAVPGAQTASSACVASGTLGMFWSVPAQLASTAATRLPPISPAYLSSLLHQHRWCSATSSSSSGWSGS